MSNERLRRAWRESENGAGKNVDVEKMDEKRSQAMRWDDGMSEVEQWEMRLGGRRAAKGLGVSAKKQKGGVVPLVLRPREREFREAGQALITLLALDGTCNSQRIRRTGPRRSSTPSLCAAVCVQPLSHFPSSSFLMPFWREWARKIFNLATISDWKKESSQTQVPQGLVSSGPWMQQIPWEIHWFATAAGYEQAILALAGGIPEGNPDIAQRNPAF